MNLLHDAIMENLRPLTDAGSTTSEVDDVGMDVWSCFSIVASYCCNLLQKKNMSFVKQCIAIALTSPCVRFLVNKDDICDLEKATEDS